jgi:hypothetical protein
MINKLNSKLLRSNLYQKKKQFKKNINKVNNLLRK